MNDLRWQSNHKKEQIRDCQAEEIVVGGSLHVLVLGYDDTCADIPNDTADENEDMKDSDENSVEANAANVTVDI